MDPQLIDAVIRVAGELSQESARHLADALGEAGTASDAHARIGNLATGRQRELLEAIVTGWEGHPGVTGGELAAALQAAQAAQEEALRRERVELILTGPRPPGSLLRRTDQALFEVVDRAAERLLIVTYLAYKVPELEARLRDATQRGVEIRLVLESPASEGGKASFDPFRALESSVPGAELFRWPATERPLDRDGRSGALHTKCAVADGGLAFISSANLTDDALESNMELGVLIEGQEIATRISRHFNGLIEAGVLQKVS